MILRSILCLLILSPFTIAEEDKLPELRSPLVNGPYCGIHSLFFCLDSLGMKTEFGDFISTRFVGSPQGSSASELIDAVQHFGAHAAVFSNLTLTELYRIKQPMILHVRSSWENSGYDHWIAFLGFDGHHARILDYPRPLQKMPLAELLAKWDSTAIIVSKKPVNTAFIYWSKFDLFVLIATLFSMFYFFSCVFKKWNEQKNHSRQQKYLILFRQSVTLILITVVIGVGYHYFSPVGFLQNPEAVADITRRYYSSEIPEISLQELNLEMDVSNSPLLIDARHSIDFQHGVIPKAVSMPIDSSLPERQQVLKGTQQSQRILVYCQSQYCGYAEEIAKFLKFNGYENIALYRGGYREWSETKKQGE